MHDAAMIRVDYLESLPELVVPLETFTRFDAIVD